MTARSTQIAIMIIACFCLLLGLLTSINQEPSQSTVRVFKINWPRWTPAEVTVLQIGDREYELVPLPVLKLSETCVYGDEMVRRAEALDANSGKDDGEYILAHQANIPAELRKKIHLVFPAWRHPDDPGSVAYSLWYETEWVQNWSSFDSCWSNEYVRLVRSLQPAG